jgi:hypothetical protein
MDSGMRKLAREAVIFALLGWIILTASTFVYFRMTVPTNMNPPAQACLDFNRGDCNNMEFLKLSLFFGLGGFPAGLGIWMFYRVVRFAIKG